MRRVTWLGLTLALIAASFLLGRWPEAAHTLPAMVATLPGEEAGFSREFDDRIRARFPTGSSEDALIDYLVSEKFAPDWRRRDAANASVLVLNGLICQKVVRVNWRADASGVLRAVSGAYESHCI